jgi:eukaryotic-like serine/threonine-protein kinase
MSQVGGYQILERVGEGGMGVVYKAMTPDGRIVAVKVLKPDRARNPKTVERFHREAKSASRLRHPNIIQIYKSGVDNGIHYLVMEFIEGESLDTLLERSGGLTAVQVVTIGHQICTALEAAHRIVHRDIKASNIMSDKTGRFVVTDFGIAKDYDLTEMTQSGEIFGSLPYMSPQQCQGQPIDKRTDIYSTGILLYQLLTGKVPFQGDIAAVMRQHISAYPQWPSQIPIRLQTVIQKALAKNPADRYRSAGEFGRSLATSLTAPVDISPHPQTQGKTLNATFSEIWRENPTLIKGFAIFMLLVWFLLVLMLVLK